MVLRQCLSTTRRKPSLHLCLGEGNRLFEGQSIFSLNRHLKGNGSPDISNACFPLLTIRDARSDVAESPQEVESNSFFGTKV